MPSLHKIFLLLLVTVISASLLGQSDNARLVGTITDASGAVSPGATVTVTNLGTGRLVSVKTNASGEYVVTELAFLATPATSAAWLTGIPVSIDLQASGCTFCTAMMLFFPVFMSASGLRCRKGMTLGRPFAGTRALIALPVACAVCDIEY